MKEFQTCVSLLEFRPSRVFRANLASSRQKKRKPKDSILPRWGVKIQRVFYSPKKIFWQVCETRGEELELLRGPIPKSNLENL